MTNLAANLLNFTPISLEEMDRVKLLDRIDTKYVFNQDMLENYMLAIVGQYKILSIDGKLVHPYETLYYDTPDYSLYRMHHNGRQNRFKLRFRKYLNSNISFFEIKKKTNTHRTIKKRVSVEDILETLNDPLKEFIANHTPDTTRTYVPSLRVYFNRITLVNIFANERLTIDTDLRYTINGHEKCIEKMVIAEVKQEKHNVSPFQQLMLKKRLRGNYISKYCMGVVCLIREVKKK
ncbi:MAG: polyphosphate polymerase domain-containing protein [Bacteroidota bacterium]